MLYSPTTGIHQAAELKELKDGPHCLADIVEAASRSLTLDQLAQSGAIGYTSATTATKTCLESTGFFWLDITEPTPDEMDSLARAFGIHPLTIEDILTDAGDRDKMESISDYTFLIYRAVDTGTSEEAPRSDGIEATGFSIIIKPSCILTFHSECSTSHVANTLAKLQEISTISQLSAIASPVYVAYALVDNITDSLVPMMRALEVEVDAVDELILVLSQKERSDMLQRIGAVRRRILGIWRLLLGKPDVLRLFSRLMVQVLMAEEMGKAAVEGDDQPKADADTVTMEGIEHYLSDVHDHLVAMISSCSHCEMVLARSHSNYMAQISLELGEATVDTGVFSNRWLVIAAILLPIQFVTGLFGQNVKVPWKPDSDTGAYDDTKAFFGIFGCCMAYVVIVSTWAWYKKIF
ncbi:CorA metal ion transporter [Dipsacomyces acuminosporus]|nr:CorA metal ion transporter [Dipsacomyces acuminosporus]